MENGGCLIFAKNSPKQTKMEKQFNILLLLKNASQYFDQFFFNHIS